MTAASWGSTLATVLVTSGEDHSAMDYNEHNRTYAGFLSITKYSIIFLVLLLAGMKFFLV
jgi:hypothetical protein